MRGKLSCPVLKAGRRERSLLPSYQNGSHYVRDVTFGEDRSRLRTGNAPQILAALRNLAITLIHRFGSSHIKATRLHFASCPQEALALLSQKRGGQQSFTDPEASQEKVLGEEDVLYFATLHLVTVMLHLPQLVGLETMSHIYHFLRLG